MNNGVMVYGCFPDPEWLREQKPQTPQWQYSLPPLTIELEKRLIALEERVAKLEAKRNKKKARKR